MNLEKMRNTEYLKCVNMLAELIDLDTDTREKIYKCFQSMGIKDFFLYFESVGLSPETVEKVKNIRAIIELSDVKRGRV